MVQVHTNGTTTHPEAGALYRATFLPHDPASKARMNGPKAGHKYTHIPEPVTNRDIAAVLAGSETYAALLIGADGMAWALALDVDHGGIEALERVLRAAHRRRLIAFALTSRAGEHDGGHVWVLFDGPVKAEWLRALALDLATEAGIERPEAYPSGKHLRLPLGKHTHTGKRGVLMLQDGTRLDLDAPGAVAKALGIIAALPRNPAALVPEPQPAPQPAPTVHAIRPLGATERPIHAFNQATDLIALVESYGGRDAGGGLMHCPSPDHKRGDRNASLHVRPARAAKFGRLICGCYAPGCRLHTEAGQVLGPFDVFCLLEGLSTPEAVRRITGAQARAPRPQPAPSPEPPRTMQTPAQRSADATRKREARRREAAQILAEVRARADADKTMPPAARRLIPVLLEIAGERASCRPSVARLAAMTGKSERTTQNGLAWLEGRYITTTHSHGKGTSWRTFTRVQNVEPAPEAPSAQTAPEYMACIDLVSTPELLVSPPPVQSEPEPAPAVDDGQVVLFEGGASYNPDWSVLDAAKVPEPAPELSPAPVRYVPPTEPKARRRYFALLGKAGKPGISEAQRRRLRRMATALEIVATEPLEPVVAPPTPVLTQTRQGAAPRLGSLTTSLEPRAVRTPAPAPPSATAMAHGPTGGALQATPPVVPPRAGWGDVSDWRTYNATMAAQLADTDPERAAWYARLASGATPMAYHTQGGTQ